MNDLRTNFIRWYFNEFHITDLYAAMVAVTEDSPWHREVNVGIHTDMVVGEYLSRAISDDSENEWSEEDMLGAFAAAFHDVGKPAARTEAYKPERGTYYRYGGHELISARLWEDWAVRNWDFLVREFNFSVDWIYCVGWLIENHLPWAIKKPEKRKQLALGVMRTVMFADYFTNLVKADTWGRISDDQDEKRQKVNDWCSEFEFLFEKTTAEFNHRYVDDDAPILYIPVGAAGSGKSTFVNELHKRDSAYKLDVFSLDELRLRWYVEGKNIASAEDAYGYAFKKSCDDKHFKSQANAEFLDLVRNGNNIVVDNVNTSRKSRGWYITEARKRGYRITALMFPIDLQTVLDRQHTRPDKTVPEDAVRQQYMRLSYPSLGEVDTIEVVAGTLAHSD